MTAACNGEIVLTKSSILIPSGKKAAPLFVEEPVRQARSKATFSDGLHIYLVTKFLRFQLQAVRSLADLPHFTLPIRGINQMAGMYDCDDCRSQVLTPLPRLQIGYKTIEPLQWRSFVERHGIVRSGAIVWNITVFFFFEPTQWRCFVEIRCIFLC